MAMGMGFEPERVRDARGRLRIVWCRTDGLRYCSGCSPEQGYLSPDLFSRSRSSCTGDGVDNYCQTCRSAAQQRTYRRYKARYAARRDRWKAAHPEQWRVLCRRANRVYRAVRRLDGEREEGAA